MATAAFALMTMAIAVPDRREDLQLDRHPLGRAPDDAHADDVRPRLHLDVHDRRPLRASCTPPRPPTPQQHGSYFIVAHFHYVLIGGSLFALFAGIHYWFPLMFGRQGERVLGQDGLLARLRRVQRDVLPDALPRPRGHAPPHVHLRRQHGLEHGQLWSTVGAFILAIGVAVYFVTMIYTFFKGERTTRDPWDARTLEWSLPNPPPEYNFRVLPDRPRPRRLVVREAPQGGGRARGGRAREGRGRPRRHPHALPVDLPVPARAVGILIGAIGVAVVDPANPAQYPGFWGPKIAVTILGGGDHVRLRRPLVARGQRGLPHPPERGRQHQGTTPGTRPAATDAQPSGPPTPTFMSSTAAAATIDHHHDPTTTDGHSEQEAPHVGLPGVGLHVLRLPDLDAPDLPAAPAPGHARRRGRCSASS